MAAVPSTLGGGVNGYLDMLISAAQYATMAPMTPFVPPPMAGALIIDSDMTQYQIVVTKTQNDVALRKHKMYVLLQRALISLVQEATEPKCTNAVRNQITGKLPPDIHMVKNHMFDTYSKINKNELQTKYNEITRITYNVSNAIDEISTQ